MEPAPKEQRPASEVSSPPDNPGEVTSHITNRSCCRALKHRLTLTTDRQVRVVFRLAPILLLLVRQEVKFENRYTFRTGLCVSVRRNALNSTGGWNVHRCHMQIPRHCNAQTTSKGVSVFKLLLLALPLLLLSTVVDVTVIVAAFTIGNKTERTRTRGEQTAAGYCFPRRRWTGKGDGGGRVRSARSIACAVRMIAVVENNEESKK